MFDIIIVLALLIGVIDTFTYRIPDWTLIALFICGVLSVAFFNGDEFHLHIISGTLSFSLFFLVYKFKGGLGFGDVKYAAVLGFILGLRCALVAFTIATSAGILFILSVNVARKRDRLEKIPYGPFLSLGLITMLIYQVVSR